MIKHTNKFKREAVWIALSSGLPREQCHQNSSLMTAQGINFERSNFRGGCNLADTILTEAQRFLGLPNLQHSNCCAGSIPVGWIHSLVWRASHSRSAHTYFRAANILAGMSHFVGSA